MIKLSISVKVVFTLYDSHMAVYLLGKKLEHNCIVADLVRKV